MIAALFVVPRQPPTRRCRSALRCNPPPPRGTGVPPRGRLCGSKAISIHKTEIQMATATGRGLHFRARKGLSRTTIVGSTTLPLGRRPRIDEPIITRTAARSRLAPATTTTAASRTTSYTVRGGDRLRLTLQLHSAVPHSSLYAVQSVLLTVSQFCAILVVMARSSASAVLPRWQRRRRSTAHCGRLQTCASGYRRIAWTMWQRRGRIKATVLFRERGRPAHSHGCQPSPKAGGNRIARRLPAGASNACASSHQFWTVADGAGRVSGDCSPAGSYGGA